MATSGNWLFGTISIWVSSVILLTGCAASVDEKHYFAAVGRPTAENPAGIVNIFRLKVNAKTGLANARYIAGTYDERAVDFFFNEVKSEDYKPSGGLGFGPDKIFPLTCPTKDDSNTEKDECKEAYQQAIKVIPLSPNTPDDDFSAFVIILSTNANAIAETIGAIAESEVAIQSVNYLINKDTFESAERFKAEKALLNRERNALVEDLTARFAKLESDESPNSRSEMAILRAIAIALEPDKQISFDTTKEADAWFSTVN